MSPQGTPGEGPRVSMAPALRGGLLPDRVLSVELLTRPQQGSTIPWSGMSD